MTLPSVHFPDAGQQLRRFLQAAYVPVNLRRDVDGYIFDISVKALKKRVLLAGEFTQDAHSFQARLVVGQKFVLVAYLRSFSGPDRCREAHVEVQDLEV